MHITSQYLASEEKVVMATTKVEALEAQALGLRKDLIVRWTTAIRPKKKIKTLTEQLNAEKQLVKQRDEQLAGANQKMKNVVAVAKAIHAFQLTKEYNAILFCWYFKGFELQRRYLIKHGLETDLEDSDFEAIDKEIEVDEEVQAAQVAASASEDPLVFERGGNDTPEA